MRSTPDSLLRCGGKRLRGASRRLGAIPGHCRGHHYIFGGGIFSFYCVKCPMKPSRLESAFHTEPMWWYWSVHPPICFTVSCQLLLPSPKHPVPAQPSRLLRRCAFAQTLIQWLLKVSPSLCSSYHNTRFWRCSIVGVQFTVHADPQTLRMKVSWKPVVEENSLLSRLPL